MAIDFSDDPQGMKAVWIAEHIIYDKGEVSPEDRDACIKHLFTVAGYRMFSENYFCHKVVYFDAPHKANLYGLAIRLLGQCYIGGPSHGTPCGRDKNFDKIDRQCGQVYGVTCQ